MYVAGYQPILKNPFLDIILRYFTHVTQRPRSPKRSFARRLAKLRFGLLGRHPISLLLETTIPA
jgi:hypothetical protein